MINDLIHNNSHDFELLVLQLLERLCDSNEEIYTDYLVPDNNKDEDQPRVMVDFYLPHGCKTMDWTGPTCVEVKSRLTSTALSHLRKISDLSSYPIKLITDEGYDNKFRYNQYFGKKDITWYSIGSLYERLDSRKGSEKRGGPHKKDSKSSNAEIKKGSESPSIVIKGNDPKELAKNAFKNGNITLFLGAGVSVGAGLPQWKSLLQELLKDENQSPLKESDYAAIDVAAYNSNIIAARYLLYPYSTDEKKLEGGDKLRDALYRDYDQTKQDLELVNTIVDICRQENQQKQRYVSSIITFNYDDLVENVMEEQKIPYVSITNEKKYELGKFPIIHVHGILSRGESNLIPILSEESYHQLYDTFNSTTNIEIVHALYRNTCIFIGLSMTDPNLRRLLESVRIKSGENSYHYAILPLVSLDHCNWDAATPSKYYKEDKEKNDEFRKRQERVFESLGVKVIWFPEGEYKKIPEILREIADIDKKSESNDVSETTSQANNNLSNSGT